MAHTSTTISRNVWVSDVKAVLGSTSNHIIQLCQHANINKFARCKPYGFGGIAVMAAGLDEATRRANNYGMTPVRLIFPTAASLTEGIQKAQTWGQWAPPTGIEPQVCRLGDFDGYNSNAMHPIEALRVYTDAGYNYSTPIVYDTVDFIGRGYMYARLTLSRKAYQLSLADFSYGSVHAPLGDMHLTMLLLNRDGAFGTSSYIAAQAEATLAGGGTEVLLKLEELDLSGFFSQSQESLVAVGLAARIEPDLLGHVVTGAIPCADIVSLNMFTGDNFPCMIYHPRPAVFGTSGAGGIKGQTTTKIKVRILKNLSAPGASVSTPGTVSVGLDYSSPQARLTFAPLATSDVFEADARAFVDVYLSDTSTGALYLIHSEPFVTSSGQGADGDAFKIGNVAGTSSDVSFLDNLLDWEFSLNALGIPSGTYRPAVRLRLDIPDRETATQRQHFELYDYNDNTKKFAAPMVYGTGTFTI